MNLVVVNDTFFIERSFKSGFRNKWIPNIMFVTLQ